MRRSHRDGLPGSGPIATLPCSIFPGRLSSSGCWGRPSVGTDHAHLRRGLRLLVILGLVMSAWSHRGFGRSSPGLVGYIAFLHYYLSLDYALVAQRDWHGPVLVVLGMLLVQSWPRMAASVGSGLLFGLAFVIRPHVLLFAPAVALAVAMSSPASGQANSRHPKWNRTLPAWPSPRVWASPRGSRRWPPRDCSSILCGGCGM